MVAAVTIVPNVASDKSARLTLTVTDADVDETMSVYRVDGSDRLAVLGALNIPAASTVLVDALVGLNRTIRWVVVCSDGSEVSSATVTVPAARPILSDPWQGNQTYVTVVDEDDTLAMRSRAEVLLVEGSAQPVAVTDVPVGYFGRLELLALTANESDAIEELTEAAAPMFLRCSCGLHPDIWVQPTSDLEKSRLVKRPADEARRHTWDECIYLPEPPNPNVQAAADTLGELNDAVPGTLQDIANTWSTLGAIAASDLSGGI